STASQVTGVSGRGVGMDGVKTNISKLNGSIEIETLQGKGTKMILRLPLTLAIIHALMVRTGVEDYALPLQSVVEILKADESDLRTVDSREVVYSRDRVYPLIRLSEVVGNVSTGRNGSGYAVLISYGEKTFALLVDELLGQEEVVIKTLGGYLGNTKGVSGATITGDGKVVLILDIVSLCTEAASSHARQTRP
ncbi:MAG: chemotaxis protein CheW, partial [Deltaproteobacteria bacterium]|nr:chemotaxis protein CheW [Deltaproteobacteria bacterium]